MYDDPVKVSTMAILPKPNGDRVTPEMKPIGGLNFLPLGLQGKNQPAEIGLRRAIELDSLSRVSAQAAHDRGIYMRQPVGPVEYSEGNIKKSTELTGVAGYNQKQIPLKDSADDMSQQEYIQSITDNTPSARKALQIGLLGDKQYFLNAQQMNDTKIVQSYNMADSLMNLARAKKVVK